MSHIVDQPSVPSQVVTDHAEGAPHSHPLPKSLRLGAVIYGAVLAVVLTAQALIFINAEEERDAQIAAAKNAVLAELERAKAERDAADAAADAEVRAAVCIVLPDLPSPSEDVQRLADVLGCPVDPAASPGRPAPAPQAGSTAPSTTAPPSSAGRPDSTERPAEAPPAPPAQPDEPPPPSPPEGPEPPGPLPPVTCDLLPPLCD